MFNKSIIHRVYISSIKGKSFSSSCQYIHFIASLVLLYCWFYAEYRQFIGINGGKASCPAIQVALSPWNMSLGPMVALSSHPQESHLAIRSRLSPNERKMGKKNPPQILSIQIWSIQSINCNLKLHGIFHLRRVYNDGILDPFPTCYHVCTCISVYLKQYMFSEYIKSCFSKPDPDFDIERYSLNLHIMIVLNSRFAIPIAISLPHC